LDLNWSSQEINNFEMSIVQIEMKIKQNPLNWHKLQQKTASRKAKFNSERVSKKARFVPFSIGHQFGVSPDSVQEAQSERFANGVLKKQKAYRNLLKMVSC
jgi:hypothetical protein